MVLALVTSPCRCASSMEELSRRASALKSRGDLSGAMEIYEEALDNVQSDLSQKRSACFELGLLKEVSGDVTTALKYFEDAAKLGHPGAQLSVAVAVSSAAYPDAGFEPERFQNASREDVAVLHEYFAALGDEPLAQMALGYRHMYGVGVPAKCEAALEYYGAAADAAVKSAKGGVWVPNDRMRIGEDDVPVTEWWGGSLLFGGRAGKRAESGGKKSHLLRYYQHAARQGDVHSQLTLGHLHYHGSRSVKQNLTKARRWFGAAADKGDPVASSWLGYMEVRGLGGPQGDGLKHLLIGEKHGEHIALIGLGVAKLKTGDRVSATNYFKKASEKHSDALYNLGLLQLGWDGTDKSEEIVFAASLKDKKKATKAMQYFSLAARSGHVRALHKVGRLFGIGVGGSSCDGAAKMLKSVAERGPWLSQLATAHRLFENGDSLGARLLYAKLAHAGYEVAQSNAAWLVARHGDLRSALSLYELAAKQGNAEASVKLGDVFFYGRGIQADYEKAVAKYQAAHDSRHPRAAFNLAWCYQNGFGVKQRDFHLAKRHYGSATDFSPEALWPVRIALVYLYFDWARYRFFNYWHQQRQPRSIDQDEGDGPRDEQTDGRDDERRRRPVSLDDKLLAAAASALAILLSMRLARGAAAAAPPPAV